ncbi:hypothetical protein BDZ90DRAFT_268270 [Jaminaea rosea]|uniref:Uncharacterized protein n=1 Tax=Jaminaea rosea TaxID=1569628 RepID=A0A316UJK6_9BASI|nr:hypothetical protein BDZ90DRAFT_268270 [Jaminaea rosea]PWN25400.1 hypothetical protein BDZ90DRAFT_268270 [Jaminaea rosea]
MASGKQRPGSGDPNDSNCKRMKSDEPSNSHAASLANFWFLPEELRIYIIDLACYVEPVKATSVERKGKASTNTTKSRSGRDVNVLASLALVSRRFNSCITPLLYRMIKITRPSELATFYKCLALRPDNGAYIRDLHLGPIEDLAENWWPTETIFADENGETLEDPVLLLRTSLSSAEEEVTPRWCEPNATFEWGDTARGRNCQDTAVNDALKAAVHYARSDGKGLCLISPYGESVRMVSRAQCAASLSCKLTRKLLPRICNMKNDWAMRVLRIRACLDLYLMEMRRIEDQKHYQVPHWPSPIPLDRGPDQCRQGHCSHYPRLIVTPSSGEKPDKTNKYLAEDNTKSGMAEMDQKGVFTLSKTQLDEHISRKGGLADHFDHPLLVIRSRLMLLHYDYAELKIDHAQAESMMYYYSEIEADYRCARCGKHIDDDDESCDEEEHQKNHCNCPAPSRSDQNNVEPIDHFSSTKISDVFNTSDFILSQATNLVNASFASILHRPLWDQQTLQQLRYLSLGPTPPGWEDELRWDHVHLPCLEQLRIAFSFIDEISLGSSWIPLARCPSFADSSGIVPSRLRTDIRRTANTREQGEEVLQPSSISNLPAKVRPRSIEVRLHPNVISDLLAMAPTAEIRAAWQRGLSMPDAPHRLRLVKSRAVGDSNESSWLHPDQDLQLISRGERNDKPFHETPTALLSLLTLRYLSRRSRRWRKAAWGRRSRRDGTARGDENTWGSTRAEKRTMQRDQLLLEENEAPINRFLPPWTESDDGVQRCRSHSCYEKGDFLPATPAGHSALPCRVTRPRRGELSASKPNFLPSLFPLHTSPDDLIVLTIVTVMPKYEPSRGGEISGGGYAAEHCHDELGWDDAPDADPWLGSPLTASHSGHAKSTPSLVNFWTLPHELRTAIFSLAADLTSYQPDVATLASLSCVSSSFHTEFNPLLYKQVQLTRPSKLGAFYRGLTPRNGKLVRSLHLGPIEVLSGSWWPLDEDEHPNLKKPLLWIKTSLNGEDEPDLHLPRWCRPERDFNWQLSARDCQTKAVHGALQTALREIDIDPYETFADRRGADIGIVSAGKGLLISCAIPLTTVDHVPFPAILLQNEWTLRLFRLQACLDLYLVEMARLEDERGYAIQDWQVSSRPTHHRHFPYRCRTGSCEHYPRVHISTRDLAMKKAKGEGSSQKQKRKKGVRQTVSDGEWDRDEESPPSAARDDKKGPAVASGTALTDMAKPVMPRTREKDNGLVFSLAHLDQHLAKGRQTDHFDHPLLIARTPLKFLALDDAGRVKVDHDGSERHDYYSDEGGICPHCGDIGCPEAPYLIPLASGSAPRSSPTREKGARGKGMEDYLKLNGVLDISRSVLALTPGIVNLSCTGYLHRSIWSEGLPYHNSLRCLSVGPMTHFQEDSLDELAYADMPRLERLRLCGERLTVCTASAIAGLPPDYKELNPLPHLREVQWDTGNETDGDEMRHLRILDKLQGSGSRSRARRIIKRVSGMKAGQGGPFDARATSGKRDSRLIHVRLHPSVVKGFLEDAASPTIQMAWQQGLPVRNGHNRLLLTESRALGKGRDACDCSWRDPHEDVDVHMQGSVQFWREAARWWDTVKAQVEDEEQGEAMVADEEVLWDEEAD